jgi:hypothetical protein
VPKPPTDGQPVYVAGAGSRARELREAGQVAS